MDSCCGAKAASLRVAGLLTVCLLVLLLSGHYSRLSCFVCSTRTAAGVPEGIRRTTSDSLLSRGCSTPEVALLRLVGSCRLKHLPKADHNLRFRHSQLAQFGFGLSGGSNFRIQLRALVTSVCAGRCQQYYWADAMGSHHGHITHVLTSRKGHGVSKVSRQVLRELCKTPHLQGNSRRITALQNQPFPNYTLDFRSTCSRHKPSASQRTDNQQFPMRTFTSTHSR